MNFQSEMIQISNMFLSAEELIGVQTPDRSSEILSCSNFVPVRSKSYNFLFKGSPKMYDATPLSINDVCIPATFSVFITIRNNWHVPSSI